MATLSHSALETLWVLNGGLQQDADTAAAIAQAESGGCQYAKHGPTDDRPVKECTYTFSTLENSYGLWQINRDAHPQYSASSLYTLDGNAAAAADIRRANGNFNAWTTYKNGAYKRFLTGTVSTTPQPGGILNTAPPAPGQSSIAGFHQVGLVLSRGLPQRLHTSLRLGQQTQRNLARFTKEH